MASALLVMWLALLPGFAIGYVGHELAHWVVLQVAGRESSVSLWPPRVSFAMPTPVPLDVRFAAIAPALAGVAVLVGAILSGGALGVIGWGVVIGACARLFALSPADRRLARGAVERSGE